MKIRVASLMGLHHSNQAKKAANKLVGNVKNERKNVPISFWNETKTFWYRSRICLIVKKQIVLIWSRICSPHPNKNDLFR